MKRILAAVLLVSIATYADKGATPVTTISKVEIANPQTWPSVDELWNSTETGYGIKQALINGTPSVEVLVGYEHSDLAGNGTRIANAALSRTRLNYQTGAYKGFDGFVQAQYVGPFNDHYAPEDPAYDTVADPEEFRFHQAYLGYTGFDSKAKIGAQEIILDNARLIGNVGWRLNAQSFNAASIANHSISNVTLFYAYADSFNDIWGDYIDERQYHMFNAEFAVCDGNKASTFAYLQRNDSGFGADEVDTFGGRIWGKNDIISHDIMVALQRQAEYVHIFAEADLDAVNVGGGVEYISGGSSSHDQFQTLNGTAHKFNGWADQFLATGGNPNVDMSGGLVDGYGQISGKVCEKVSLLGVYHVFHTATENATDFEGVYGQEIDAQAKMAICKNFTLLAKAAYYMKGENDAGNFTNNETVFWLRGTFKF